MHRQSFTVNNSLKKSAYGKLPGLFVNSANPFKVKSHPVYRRLINYLFPVVDDARQFHQQHLSVQSSLKKQLIEILSPIAREQEIDIMQTTDEYFDGLENIKDKLLKDAQLILEFDPAAFSLEEVILSYPGFRAIIVHRFANGLYRLNIPLIPRMMSEWAHSNTGIDINPGASIGCPFLLIMEPVWLSVRLPL